MKSHGEDPEEGWYFMGAMIAVDILFAQRHFWMQLIGAGALWYAIEHILPSNGGTYVVCSAILFVSMSLLFARDIALRMRGGVYVFPILGALVGAATAPAMYLDYAADPYLIEKTFTYLTWGVGCLAVLRTWNRYWVQNCGWIAQKVNGRWAHFETEMLKPKIWPIPVVALLFASIACLWCIYAGPGVGKEAKLRLAKKYLKSYGMEERGEEMLRDAANKGYPPAIRLYAEMLIEEAPEKAYELAGKGAELGDAECFRIQGECLEKGVGVECNLTEANAKFAKAVELGDEKAIPMKARTDKIAKYWSPAHEGDAEAMIKLASYFSTGNGIAKDEKTARMWALKAADAGLATAQYLAGALLWLGQGGPKDRKTAVSYYEKAAEQDFLMALETLGGLYATGLVVTQDYAKAFHYYERASNLGSGEAAYSLGYYYSKGEGVETNDHTKAFAYFKLADERGVLPGSYALGNAYENGLGVEADQEKALAAYTRASARDWKDSLSGKTVEDSKEGCRRIGTLMESADKTASDADEKTK